MLSTFFVTKFERAFFYISKNNSLSIGERRKQSKIINNGLLHYTFFGKKKIKKPFIKNSL